MATWSAEDYRRNSGEQQKWARELIGKLNLRGDERVLDIGCGDGKVTAEIARRVPRGIARALRKGGRMLLQMGGSGNAGDVLTVMNEMIRGEGWGSYFEAFEFPYGIYAPAEYREWLAEAGLEAVRVELIPKEMVHDGIGPVPPASGGCGLPDRVGPAAGGQPGDGAKVAPPPNAAVVVGTGR